MLPKQTGISEYVIELEEDKQPAYKPIYSLRPVEFKTLKTYIKINLANGFIHLLNSLTSVSILFGHKPDNNLRLYINY